MILVLAGALLEISVSALAGLMLTGSARYLVVGSAVGLVLAAAWIRPWRGLPLVTGFLGLVLGLILVRLPQGGSGAGTLHGLVSERLQSTALPAASGVVLTICVVIIATGCGWLLFERRTPWPVVALAASAYFVRADVSKSYEDHIPLFLIGALILILCTYLPVSRWMWSAVPVLALACGLMAVAWRLPAAQVTLSQHLFDPVSLLSRPGLPGNGSRVLTLTTPFYPTNTPIMQVRINRAGLRPYWQSQIFDQYDGHSWVASNSVQRAVPAGGSLTPGAASPRQTVIAMVSVFQPTEDLVFPGTPLRASV
ncbi:MAG: hypothetical protein ACRDFX_12995, partial [Chloroflexota bacterium]